MIGERLLSFTLTLLVVGTIKVAIPATLIWFLDKFVSTKQPWVEIISTLGSLWVLISSLFILAPYLRTSAYEEICQTVGLSYWLSIDSFLAHCLLLGIKRSLIDFLRRI
jgi:hypothetical protein